MFVFIEINICNKMIQKKSLDLLVIFFVDVIITKLF